MIGEYVIINSDDEALKRETVKITDQIIETALKAFGVEYSDVQELKGRIGAKRKSDWHPGRTQYFIDGLPFLEVRMHWNPQMVRLSWDTIDKPKKEG